MPPSSQPTPTAPSQDAFRLPRTVTPHTYRIEIEPDVGSATFSGTVEIDVTVNETLNDIVLNAADLAISDVEARSAGGTIGCTVSFDDDLEQVTFHSSTALPPGPCTLSCRFTGTLNDKLRGFYRSTFTDEAGETQTIATTQFESVDARRAFPCWDEPDRKATYEITLIIERDVDAYSNSPIVSVERIGEKNRVRFSPTMKMSTYLVAFIVGKLETTETVDVDGVPLRVVFPPGKRGLADFALAIGAFSLRFFTEYFNIPYPGEKVDLVAIPDFAAGAMENLGCITFRDTALLIDPKTAARAELERVADVVAHELAHMWFGDLVTMGWWEGIWLNEAFATFMETLCVDAFRPAWDRWVGFAPSREAALAIDGVHATRPIEYPVGPPKEAEGMFDLLTYEKGCAVLRMLEQHIGPEIFRDGVRAYLDAHAYANTVTTDLWDALEEASGAPVRDVMNTFILQGGHPLITLSGDTLTQQPFSFGPVPKGTESAIGTSWNAPVAVRALAVDGATGAPERKLVLGDAPATLPEVAEGLVVVNAGGWGVFRVGYEAAHSLALADHLSDLTPLERANLLADTWATTLAGHSTLVEFLTLAAKLGLESDPTPWSPVGSAVLLSNRIVNKDDRPSLEDAVAALFGPIHRHLGFEALDGEGERTPTLRSLAITVLGTAGADSDVRAEAARRFDASIIGGDTHAIPADVEAATLTVVAQLVRPGDYEALLERYRKASTPQEEMRSLNALSVFPDTDLALRTFDLAMTEVRSQNGWLVIANLLANPVAGQAVWGRVTESWDKIFDRFPKNAHARVVESIPALCGDATFAEGIVKFLDDHPMASGPRRVAQSIERLNVNVAFAARERAHMGQTFASVVAASPPR
ncbi:MAG TPA: M1 family aminopeptidase [Acidimicrobiales bacterium]|jgi:puromycin-sensitive aminopeptidase|nr:M1 family aminopeptidase [Acidimicrobiales bacterium]